MRRLVALLLMLIVPLQFAWSAAVSLHGHVGDTPSAVGLAHSHAHDHQHTDACHEHEGVSLTGGIDPAHGEDGHHASHFHPVFNLILTDIDPPPGAAAPDGPIQHSSAAYVSRTPPPLDRPPLAFA